MGLVGEEGQGLLEGEGGFEAEGAGLGADEAAQVGAGAEGFAEVARESADVGAFGTGDADMRLGQAKCRCISDIDAGRSVALGIRNFSAD